MTVWVIALLGACIGVMAGLLGAGASILMVLLFLHVAGLDLARAVATSLAVNTVMSLVALAPYLRARAVEWRAALGFALASTFGAYFGAHLASRVPEKVLSIVFGSAVIVSGVAMLWKHPPPRPSGKRLSKRMLVGIALSGVVLGSLTGAVGLGGGFALVPLLVILARLPMRSAVGTSLFVIALNTSAGLIGHLPEPRINPGLAVRVGIAASVGSVLGARLHGRLDADVLRRAFGVLLLVVALLQLRSVFRS